MKQRVLLIFVLLFSTTLLAEARSKLYYVEAVKWDSESHRPGFDEGIRNPVEAYEWLTKETELRNYTAQTLLALMFHYGIYVEKDTDLALSMLLESASHQEAMALCLLADAYENGDMGIIADKDMAKHLDGKIGHSQKQLVLLDLAIFFHDASDYENEMKYLKIMSTSNPLYSSDRMCRMGELYYMGNGVIQDHNKAFELFTKAAEAAEFPNQNAMKRLADCYRYGRGTPQNFEKAEYWLQKAIEKGNDDAEKIVQLNRGVMLMSKEDYEGAYECFKSSQGDQDPKTLFCYGMMCYNGIQAQKDYNKAFELFKEAAELLNIDAMNMLSSCYRHGKGVTRDIEKAEYWLKKAQETESADADSIKQ